MRSVRSALAAVCAPALIVVGIAGNPRDDTTLTAPTAAVVVDATDPGSDPDVDSSTTATDCADFDQTGVEFQRCWEEIFERVARTVGIGDALSAVHERGRDNPRVLAICHDFKHSLGRIGLELHATPLEALKYDDLACQYGYRHGVLEAFAAIATDDTMADTMSQLCTQLPTLLTAADNDSVFAEIDIQREQGECLHALGHAAAVYTPDDIHAALDWCLLPGSTTSSWEGCAGGAFMEYGNSFINQNSDYRIGTSEHGPGNSIIDPETARHLCPTIRSEFVAECWLRINMFWGPIMGDDIPGMLQRCSQEAETLVDVCARSVGEWTYRMAYSVSDDPPVVAAAAQERCANPDPVVEGNCLHGVVFPMRGSAIWGEVPVDEWPLVCEGASSEQAGELCFRGEVSAIMLNPDPTRARQLIAERNLETWLPERFR